MQLLPIDSVVDHLVATVRTRSGLVVTAPPGSGKSTRVPPAVCRVVTGQVLLLQPRRIAATSLARRIAQEQGWTLGREVGHQVRFDRVGGRDTRLWVITEGILTRRFSDDPYLEGVGCVILDEFHERSLHTDLAIAWLRELQRTVREDLKIIVMSATIDPGPVSAFLDAEVLDAPGRVFPVSERLIAPDPQARLEQQVASAVDQALSDPECGDVLVFLPGTGEIRACQQALSGIDAEVLPLHGSLPASEQDRALAPSDRRKVVLSTNVAETSVTIPGVRTVIDTGSARVNRFDPDAGLDVLRLEPVSRFSLAQRAGRAGRTAPGRCWRLSTALTDARRPQAPDPELRRVDLAGTLLTLHGLGYAEARSFPWFEPPQEERLVAGETLLLLLDAVGDDGRLSPRGQAMAGLPVHPRLARLLLDAAQAGAPGLGARLAALIGERDIRPPERGAQPGRRTGTADALDRLEALEKAEREGFHQGLRSQGIDPQAAREVARLAQDLERAIQGKTAATIDAETLVPRLLLAAFPDRVARRSAPDSNRLMMVGGIPVELDPASVCATRPGQRRSELVVCTGLQGLGRGIGTSILVRQGAEISEADLEAVRPGGLERRSRLVWDAARGRIDALVGWYWADLAVRMGAGAQVDAAELSAFLAQQLSGEAERLLDDTSASFVARARWLVQVRPDLGIPALDAAWLTAQVADWCQGKRSRDEVIALPKLDWLKATLGFALAERIEALAPATILVPTGNHIRLDYAVADVQHAPVLAVRLQELFGEPATPRINDGRTPVLLHLLGPNYRCEQVTGDLASFWANTYPQVRKDLRGRYPKHSWPDDPLTAPPVARGRPRV